MTMPTKQVSARAVLIISFTLLSTVSIATTTGYTAQPVPQQDSSNLFQEIAPEERPTLDTRAKSFHESSDAAKKNYESTLVRADYIRLNWDQTIKIASALKPTVLRLFHDLSVEFVPKDFKEISHPTKPQGKKERFQWSGWIRVKDNDVGQVLFVVNTTDHTISGTIRYQNMAFRIRPLGNDRYEVTQLKLEGFPEEAKPIKREKTAPNPPNPDRTVRHDDGEGIPTPEGPGEPMVAPSPETTGPSCPIDVMVLYTTYARAASLDIEGEIYEALIQTNETFMNSKINTIIQPVYIGLIEFPEGEIESIGQALNEVSKEETNLGTSVNHLRRDWRADLVSLWVENSGRREGYCGIGYQAYSESPSDIDGFTVVRRDCATGNLSFPHEVGHNLGLGHDRYSEGTKGQADEFSNYGHVSLKSAQRTMMATNKECWDNSELVCDRLPFFSSPEFKYPGSTPPEQMGIASGSRDAANNAGIARTTACKVANFR